MENNKGEFNIAAFSSTGELSQCDNAIQTTQKEFGALGIIAKDCAIIISVKHFSRKIFDCKRIQNMREIGGQLGYTFSGRIGDFYELIKYIEEEWKNFIIMYKENPQSMEHMINSIQKEFQRATQRGDRRPYGCSLMLAGPEYRNHVYVDNSNEKGAKLETIQRAQGILKPVLCTINPAGIKEYGTVMAIGAKSKELVEELSNVSFSKLKMSDAIRTGITALKANNVYGITPEIIEIGYYNMKEGFVRLSEKQIGDYINF